jgi:hypothetical protein
MAVNNWRDRLIDHVIGKAKANGYDTYSYDVARNTLDELAAYDHGKEREHRTGANYFLHDPQYKASDRSITMLLNQVQSRWSQVPAKVEKPRPLIEKIEGNGHLNGTANDPDELTIQRLGETEQFLECTISLKMKLNQELDLESWTAWLKQKTANRIRFKLHRGMMIGEWCDLHISYATHLAKLYDALLSHPSVTDAVTKPLADFGRKTVANMRHA